VPAGGNDPLDFGKWNMLVMKRADGNEQGFQTQVFKFSQQGRGLIRGSEPGRVGLHIFYLYPEFLGLPQHGFQPIQVQKGFPAAHVH
jgi:hypothetical protein